MRGTRSDRIPSSACGYGTRLFRTVELPIPIIGDGLHGGDRPLAEIKREAPPRDFAVPVRRAESAPKNTCENARFSADILAREGIRRVYLATHAWHMPRAKAASQSRDRGRRAEVVPAPTGFTTKPAPTRLALQSTACVPSNSSYALHEWVGRLWYEPRCD